MYIGRILNKMLALFLLLHCILATTIYSAPKPCPVLLVWVHDALVQKRLPLRLIVLVFSREYGNMVYRDYIGSIFRNSLRRTSK